MLAMLSKNEHSVVSRSAFERSRTSSPTVCLGEASPTASPSEVESRRLPDPELVGGEQRRPARRREAADALDHLAAPRGARRGSRRGPRARPRRRRRAGRPGASAARTASKRSRLAEREASASRSAGTLDQRRHARRRPRSRGRSAPAPRVEGGGDGAEVGRVALGAGARADDDHHARRVEADAEPLGAAPGDGGVGAAASSSAASEAPAFQSASAARRSVLTCSAISVAARRIVTHVAAGEAASCAPSRPAVPRSLRRAGPGRRRGGGGRRPPGSGPTTKARLRVVLGQRLADLGQRRRPRGSSRRGIALVAGAAGQRAPSRVPSGPKIAHGLPSSCGQRRRAGPAASAVEHEVGQPLVDRGRPAQRVELAAAPPPAWRAARAATWVWATATAARSAKARASSTSAAVNSCGRSTSSSRISADHLAAEEHRHGHHRADLPEADGGLDDARVLARVRDDHRPARLAAARASRRRPGCRRASA